MNVEITEHYNSVLEITRLYSFISGNTFQVLDIYIWFSPTLHLHLPLSEDITTLSKPVLNIQLQGMVVQRSHAKIFFREVF